MNAHSCYHTSFEAKEKCCSR